MQPCKNTPDRWVIIHVTPGEGDSSYHILSGWSGGYLDGDEWRFSTKIENAEQNEDYYIFKTQSGSEYHCHIYREGFNGIMSNTLESFKKSNPNVLLEPIPAEQYRR